MQSFVLQETAQQIDDEEMAALLGQASARFQAVVAIADASIPGGIQALQRLGNTLVLEQLA